ncbi:phosphate ABC transporter permease PstA [Stackebrandtia nassauensis]|uniref:Phosphate transport system permease protein PstA n=1 Tax=Stackebrandtia nassauensis (strain DSM 44728 / CIP 108903 / NRRL B-16338 / NBRC 102104 / LLR-40K-21) TaxID=446470 RepID=D3Q239_STANL|nr:phosphate ABC transporter permease PstA [Stackebrandtia nassauensis]ADD41906.1 phosphate ABC transporter, inner membrane subunit PstA [Stackebrandtia nassauensis DSM 44728]
MTATQTPPVDSLPRTTSPDLGRRALSGKRRFKDRTATILIAACLLLAVLPLGLVVYQVIIKGGAILNLEFLTADIPRRPSEPGPGMGPAVVGTIVTTGLAALMAIPLGVLGAIYLNEYGKQRPLARFVRTMADVMTGVPSVMMGLFIYIVWVLATGELTAFAGALALACLMLPIVIRSSEEMLRLVPDELRQASAALGARKWRTTLTVVIPSAISGITSGSLLAIARAAGETAPIIIVVGTITRINWDAFNRGNTTLAAQIFKNASQAFPAAQERAWGAALTLIVIVLVFTILARAIASRFAIKEH